MKPILIGVMAAILAAGAQNNEAERQLKAAINAELVNGDLKAAIEQYKRIVQGPDRTIAAKALVRLGQCYEKLGDSEARTAYERVTREFSYQQRRWSRGASGQAPR